ncbi:unnamed protein product [Angiostrongylus costaricensis]|uniref:Histone domain-containing protein n=1 Tax=Angiostrongylus costaricensis TaxID=334426 RepID=A0A0R3PAS5_ANGCS|nr:unnamed protein product [Angiostrongylus costaricensis]
MLILLIFSMITPATCQLNSRLQPLPSGMLKSHVNSRTFRRPVGRVKAATFAVPNSFPNVRWNHPIQNLQQRSAIDKKAVDNFGMKNGASILAGNMSIEFIKEISEYLYDLITDTSSSQRHKSRTRSNSIRSSEVMDYEDQTRFLEAMNRSRSLSMAVVHSHRTRLNTASIARQNDAVLTGMSRRRANFTGKRILVRSDRRRYRLYGIA